MAFQSNLLNSLSESSGKSSIPPMRLVNPETEPVIEIDADNRKIKIPKELENPAVVGDHLCETIYFSCPRYFDGQDLSEKKCLFRFTNAGNEYGEDIPSDMQVLEDTIKFGWSLTNYVTRYSGVVEFTLQFELADDLGVTYQWQTTPATFKIRAGLNIEKTITDKDDILFRTLTNQIQDLQNAVSLLNEKIHVLDDVNDRLDTIEADIDYLKNNVIYAVNEL